MMMAEGMDTGDILIQKEIAIGPDMHSDELMMSLADLSASMLPRLSSIFLKVSSRPLSRTIPRQLTVLLWLRKKAISRGT
jgi:methionyl-tRNA formyltransferase